MTHGDFYETEQSTILPDATKVTITLLPDQGEPIVLKKSVAMEKGEVMDAAVMNVEALRAFYQAEMEDAKECEVLLSLHLKATMMKVSDPIMFGHAIRVYFDSVFEKHQEFLDKVGANPNQGLGSMLDKIRVGEEEGVISPKRAAAIRKDIESCLEDPNKPWLAMVDSDKGITNLHAPNDVIIDASMPVVVRDSGKMWNKFGEMEDTKCLIPDRCYATVYQEVISYVKTHGQFDVATMGSVVRGPLPSCDSACLHNMLTTFVFFLRPLGIEG